jgi:hypothetical protein
MRNIERFWWKLAEIMDVCVGMLHAMPRGKVDVASYLRYINMTINVTPFLCSQLRSYIAGIALIVALRDCLHVKLPSFRAARMVLRCA